MYTFDEIEDKLLLSLNPTDSFDVAVKLFKNQKAQVSDERLNKQLANIMTSNAILNNKGV